MTRGAAVKRTRTAGAVATAGAAAQPSAWIISRFWDSILFIGAPVLAMATLLPLRARWSSEQISVFLLAFFTFGHHLPGFIRAYGDRELFGRYRSRFLLAPPLMFVVALWFDLRDLHGLLIVVSAWDIWHVLMQHYGFMRVYDAKLGLVSPMNARLDWAVSLCWYLMLIFSSPHYRHDLLRRAYSAGLPALPDIAFSVLQTMLIAATAIATAVYACYHFQQWRKHRRVNLRKIVLLAIFVGATFYLYVGVDDFLVGFGVWSAFHCIQYYGIVWAFNRSRVDRGSAVTWFVRFLFRPQTALIFLYSGLILAYGGLNYAIAFASEESLRRILMAFTLTSTALHYYYDGFIWKIRERDTSRHLRIAAEAAGRGQRAASKLLRPGVAQVACVGAVVVALGTLETWRPPTELAMRQSIIRLAPDAGEAHFHLGEALWKQDRLKEAAESFRTAARLMPDSAQAHNNLGAVLHQQGALDEAVTHYRKALALRTRTAAASGSPILPVARPSAAAGDFAAHTNLADALVRLGRPQEALAHYRRALEIEPGSAKLRTNLGATLMSLERYEEAVLEMERALHADPAYAAAHLNLGAILAYTGEPGRALFHLEAAERGGDDAVRRAARNAMAGLRRPMQ